MTPTRIYLVRDPATGEERLIRAVNQAQARAHVARELEVTVATQDQLVALLTGDPPVVVENAGVDAETKDSGVEIPVDESRPGTSSEPLWPNPRQAA